MVLRVLRELFDPYIQILYEEYQQLYQYPFTLTSRIMATPYPNAFQIEEMFSNRDVPDIFHTYLADPIDVVVVGQDFHVGGHYKSMEAFHQGIYARVADSLKIETIRVEVRRVIGGGESAWAAVESLCTAEGKYGE